MFKDKVFVFKFRSVNGLSSGTIMIGKVTTLTHKVGDDTVEDTAFVTQTFFPSTKGSEVFGSFRYNVFSQLTQNKNVISYMV